MAHVAHLAVIVIRDRGTPTALACSNPCFLNLTATSPLAGQASSFPAGTPAVRELWILAAQACSH